MATNAMMTATTGTIHTSAPMPGPRRLEQDAFAVAADEVVGDLGLALVLLEPAADLGPHVRSAAGVSEEATDWLSHDGQRSLSLSARTRPSSVGEP